MSDSVEMTEEWLHEFVKQLRDDGIELSSFVGEHSPDLSDQERDDLVRDLEGDYFSLQEYVVQSLSEK